MSFNSHRRKLLDENQPFSHRASHARSCALLVAQKFDMKRDDLIQQLERETGIDLHKPQSSVELRAALEALEKLRLGR